MSKPAVHSTVNSEEINLLVWRYLQESGYVHAAFTFGYESQIVKSKVDGSLIPPGALLSFVQRGVNFVEIEESLINGGEAGHPGGTAAMDGVTSLLDVHRCLCNEDFKNGRATRALNQSRADTGDHVGMDVDENGAGPGADSTKNGVEVPASDALILKGHSSEVFVCAWNPRTSVLASGSGDSTARIWPIPATIPSPLSAAAAAAAQPIVLEHYTPQNSEDEDAERRRANDVTTMDWNPNGTLLATGSYDGCARIWTETGMLRHTLHLHKGPLFSLKWNKAGNYILSGSVDKTTAVWNAETGRCVKQFTFHNAPTLDVDWRDNESFASCSTDKMIFLCSLDSSVPVRVYEGHRDEINCVKFDPSGSLLASCSDDFTAKIWSHKSSGPVYDLKEHTREVYTMEWSPNTTRRLTLATASFDAMVKLWDINTGRCIRTLAQHTDPVYSLDFSSDGRFLASGSFDRSLNIWDVKDGTLVKTFRGNGGIFEVAWNPAGDKVAACFSSNTVCVIDLRKMTATTSKLN